MDYEQDYAQTPKKGVERADMQKYLLPVLRRHNNVAVYGCGHIHNFQYIKKQGDPHRLLGELSSRPIAPRKCD